MTTERKVAEVDRIISLLRLTKVENSPIKMLSGGEAKRVNIGTELLTGTVYLLIWWKRLILIDVDKTNNFYSVFLVW